jgi:hypothetical protein
VAYLLFRFGMEELKPHEDIWMGLSAIQWACLAGLAYYFTTKWNGLAGIKKRIQDGTST